MNDTMIFFLLGCLVVMSMANVIVSEMQLRAMCSLKSSIERLVSFLEKK